VAFLRHQPIAYQIGGGGLDVRLRLPHERALDGFLIIDSGQIDLRNREVRLCLRDPAEAGRLRVAPKAARMVPGRRRAGGSGVADGLCVGASFASLMACLTEPDVRLAPHPAPTLQPPVARQAATGQTDSGPVAGWRFYRSKYVQVLR
jgi:hypothetical protein